jgi:hypothetical protein
MGGIIKNFQISLRYIVQSNPAGNSYNQHKQDIIEFIIDPS